MRHRDSWVTYNIDLGFFFWTNFFIKLVLRTDKELNLVRCTGQFSQRFSPVNLTCEASGLNGTRRHQSVRGTTQLCAKLLSDKPRIPQQRTNNLESAQQLRWTDVQTRVTRQSIKNSKEHKRKSEHTDENRQQTPIKKK